MIRKSSKNYSIRFFGLFAIFILALPPSPHLSPNSLSSSFHGKLSIPGPSITINAGSEIHLISQYIYGMNFAKPSFANEIDLPVRRWGGNDTSRYNWQNGNTNTANDWYFENITKYNPLTNANETHTQWINENITTGAESILTIPMIGYVAKNGTGCGFSINKYGSQQDSDSTWRPDCGNGIDGNGDPVTGNDPLDTSQVSTHGNIQAWMQSMIDSYVSASNGGVKFYELDNEPDLWGDTHRDVHPAPQTYDELLNKTILYSTAIKNKDPLAKTLGYSSFGWTGYWFSELDTVTAAANRYTYFPDLESHDDKYQVEWYLGQLHQYEQVNEIRLLDYLDLHYYPQNGVALSTAGSASKQALRLRSIRSLWDPAYRDESWIGGDDQEPSQRYVQLIPRMQTWVDTNYPGTGLAITEYNFGGLEHINGALTQADILGIFGRESLDIATLWNYPDSGLGYDHFETLPGSYAFRMYRNYDGNGGKFGDTSISSASSDQSQLSVYGAVRSTDGALTLMIINKTAQTLTSQVSLSNFSPGSTAEVYNYSGTNLTSIIHKPDQAITPGGFTADFPPNSITLFVIQSDGPNPMVSYITTSLARPALSPEIIFSVTFSENVTGVDETDFQLVAPGLPDAIITAVSGSGKNYTVTINTGPGKGTIHLNLIDNDSIINSTSRPLGGTGINNGDFTTGDTYPVVIHLSSETTGSSITPKDNSTEKGNSPSQVNEVFVNSPAFEWSESSAQVSLYQFQLSHNRDFSSILISVETDNLQYQPQDLPFGIYYWRVRGMEPDGTWGLWSNETEILLINKLFNTIAGFH